MSLWRGMVHGLQFYLHRVLSINTFSVRKKKKKKKTEKKNILSGVLARLFPLHLIGFLQSSYNLSIAQDKVLFESTKGYTFSYLSTHAYIAGTH